MKKILLFLSIVVVSSSYGCLKDQCNETRTFARFDPVYIGKLELERSIDMMPSRELEQPGIIYVYGDYLFINEFQQGIHIIDNSNQESPQPIAFIDVPGNEHFAIVNNQLQANRYNALVTIDISNPLQAVEKARINDAFEEMYFQEGRGYLAYYRKSQQQQILDCADPNFNSVRWRNGVGGPIFTRFENDLASTRITNQVSVPGTNQVGTGGSTARFTIAANHLYTVSEYNMNIFDLEDPCRPLAAGEMHLGWDIETIYPFKEKLFIGSRSGMLIYDISNPSSPQYETTFTHANACDPVVADNTTAYVTLRDGTTCQNFVNQLDVIDVTHTTSPSLIKSYKMDNPHGLAIHGDFLYICEGMHGFKILDRTQSHRIEEIAHLTKIDARDVIVLDESHVMITGRDGIIQLDLTEPTRPRELSRIVTIQ